ncbi:hypothetical protein GCM10009546_02880 [Actinomadura livida]|uniref:Uncharacterized protein n=1 Tax=Actinomadura livida TaxID=79909 RepID=A0ABN1DI59_9ACTN|nr:hypothetical protein GCM10010208_29120 [Actinomadura livida]
MTSKVGLTGGIFADVVRSDDQGQCLCDADQEVMGPAEKEDGVAEVAGSRQMIEDAVAAVAVDSSSKGSECFDVSD